MAAEWIQYPWRSDGGAISTNLDVIWGMSVNTIGLAECFGLGGLVELPAELEKSGGQVNYGYES